MKMTDKEPTGKRGFHLKGLDTFRAVAALGVLVFHVELFKEDYGFTNLMHLPYFMYTNGHMGVILFFALSGFLITLLLLNERSKYARISLRNFYLRRIFRVWPLYYFVLLVSALALGYTPTFITLLLVMTIFPNVAHAVETGWDASPQIWSIGVEEQFYLVWPLIVKKVKNVLAATTVIFLFFTILPHATLFILHRVNPDPDPAFVKALNRLFFGAKFNCLAVGAMCAVFFNRHPKWLRWINEQVALSHGLVVLPFVLWFAGFHIDYISDEIYAILFSLSILVMASNPRVMNIDNGLTSYLGKISYGLYMYHWIVLELVFRNGLVPDADHKLFNPVVYGTAIGLTVGASSLSYHFLEKPFLRIKERYSRA